MKELVSIVMFTWPFISKSLLNIDTDILYMLDIYSRHTELLIGNEINTVDLRAGMYTTRGTKLCH